MTKWGFAVDYVLYKTGSEPPPDWTSQNTSVESPHPYTNDFDQSYEVSAPANTNELRIHFTKIHTETGYDWVEIYNGEGQLVVRYDGFHEELTTATIPGTRASIKLVTDYSVTKWGFAVDRIDYR